MSVLFDDPDAFARMARQCPPRAAGVPRGVFLIAPADFHLATESALDNRYMQMGQKVDAHKALTQHHALTQALAEQHIPVCAFPGSADTPDAVFPNNVFATAPGTLIIGAMRHAVRQREAQRSDIRAWFAAVLGYRCIDLSAEECVAELTGSLVIDRARGIGFCGLSERCDRKGARLMAEAFGLRALLIFDLAAGEYHTNVVMSALAGRAVLMCRDGFADPRVADAIARCYDRQIHVDSTEKANFVANCIALGPDGLWMSARAEAALRSATRAAIEAVGLRIHSVDLSEFERAGGSLRCMIGEVY